MGINVAAASAAATTALPTAQRHPATTPGQAHGPASQLVHQAASAFGALLAHAIPIKII